MTMQENGRCPNERPSLISSTLISGTMNCMAQDRKNCRRAVPKQLKLRKEPNATEKTVHYERGDTKRLPGWDEESCSKSNGAEKPEENAETMLYRNIWQKTKRLRRIHEVCPVCRNALRENPKHLKL